MHVYHPFDPSILADPYPRYSWLRENSPVYRVEDLDLWVISRYEDVYRALRDPATFSSLHGMGLLMGGGPPGKMRDFLRARSAGMGGMSHDEMASLRSLLASDPPDHTRLRRLVGKPFTPTAIASLEGRIREICEGLFDDLCAANERGEADLIAQLAYPLPVIVIAEMLGIPAERRDDFKRWSDDMVGTLSTGLHRESVQQSAMEMFQFFMEAIEERQGKPGEDIISLLVRNSEDGERLSTMEVLMFCVLLLVAGNETTTNLIANGALAFFAEPALWRQLKERPELVSAAVEEALRYDSPAQAIFRATTRPVELHGVEIPANAPVLLLAGSANRDPRQYPDPEAFLLTRKPKDHIAFGAGIHLCLGAPLARLEARIVAEVLLGRTRGMRQRGEITRTDSFLLRGVSRLPVAFEPIFARRAPLRQSAGSGRYNTPTLAEG